MSDEVIIWAAKHSVWLDHGRKPTKEDGPGDLLKAIKAWVIARGITYSPYAITNSIHANGTRAYRKGINRAIFDNDTFWNPRIEKLKKLLSETYISKINSISSDLWKI